MKKNDKLVVILGVVVLILASVGIYYWEPETTGEKYADDQDFFKVTGSMMEHQPDAISVSDENPFYPLIATPLVINYNETGIQTVKPLYVENKEMLSDAVKRLKYEQLDEFEVINLNEKGNDSPKNLSIEIARKYWESSPAALIIEYNYSGYCLGVMAAPLASYMRIPVIVAEKLDQDVTEILRDLGVEKTIVCGENISGFGKVKRFENVDEIFNMTMDFLTEKFKTKENNYEIDYITITNPRDAFLPEISEVNDTQTKRGKLTIKNIFPSHLIAGIRDTGGANFKFKIPDDYKYARVRIHLETDENPEYCEEFGDNVIIQGTLVNYVRTVASPFKKDEAGNIVADQFNWETTLYDSGGEEFLLKINPTFMVNPSANFDVTATIEKLDNPYYPHMPQFSSLAPYLTAYHKGLIYGKPEFAFAADDDVRLNGETLPGSTTVFRNPKLIPLLNKHVMDNIHKPINELVGKIKDIDLDDDDKQIQTLTEECLWDPLFIALVGDTIMLPQYYYRSPHNDPFNKPDRSYGTNCPSDFIYGNIDPIDYSYQPQYGPKDLENDLYPSNKNDKYPQGFPEVENIVGRITGYDIQDASALIARTVFYDEIIYNALVDEWKDNAAVLSGAGLEFQKMPIFNFIYNLLGKHDPMKFPTGEQHILGMRAEHLLKQGGFDVEVLERGQAQRVGFSKAALSEIKTDGLLNRIGFPKLLVQIIQGFDHVRSLLSLDWWKKTLSDGSGIKGGETQENSNLIMSNSHGIWFEFEHGDAMLSTMGGPYLFYQLISRFVPLIGGFYSGLEHHGAYSVREVSEMEFGPSFVFVEGCGSGKIDSIHPTNTIANAYLHAGVNAYISPTTYSAIGGYLDPRPTWDNLPIDAGVGYGIVGYLKAVKNARNNVYPPVHFCGYIFEESYQHILTEDATLGKALRDAKNDYLPNNFEVRYLWTPPLSIPSSLPQELQDEIVPTSTAGSNVPVEKYCAVYQLNLLGDPAFNPYDPQNEGKL